VKRRSGEAATIRLTRLEAIAGSDIAIWRCPNRCTSEPEINIAAPQWGVIKEVLVHRHAQATAPVAHDAPSIRNRGFALPMRGSAVIDS
jgi:hypothetical protein